MITTVRREDINLPPLTLLFSAIMVQKKRKGQTVYRMNVGRQGKQRILAAGYTPCSEYRQKRFF
jgi:hypothetical protein